MANRLCAASESSRELPCVTFFNFLPVLIKRYFLAALGLCCCLWAFSGCRGGGCSLLAVLGLLTLMASLVWGRRLGGLRASVVAAHRLSCSVACGISQTRDRMGAPAW